MTSEIIADGIWWTGTNVYTNELFEGIWPIPYGVSINSYVVKGDKIALIDLVKAGGGGSSENIINQLKSIGISPKSVDYLILNHLEPDHTGYTAAMRELNPDIQIITSEKGVPLVKAFYNIEDGVQVVDEGEELDLGGGKVLQFFYAPNVHWPETMVTYEKSNQILFSCDAFGSFGALKGYIFDDQVPREDKEFWEGETLRYYANIVAAFSQAVLAAIEKLGGLDIKIIAPSHGLIWKNPGKIIADYVRYANYMNDYQEPEITVIWGSMYGNTETIMRAVLRGIAREGVKVTIHKVPETDASFVLADAWKSAGLVIAMPTYEYSIFPPMGYVLDLMKLKHYWYKKVLRIGSFGWVGGAQKHFVEKTDKMNWDMLGPLEYQGAPKAEDLENAEALGSELARQIKEIPPKKQ
ncbi:MAG TPA: FprA family A-type flavoprotein [Candidatus Lokiarchaeia archaeon]|nr:FprA family A-type flavoprotein [Candidatus Lokiarchaeia archaeon]